MTRHRHTWKDDALCADPYMDPALFFPERAEGEVNRGEDGKAVCSRCPVTEPCLRTAIRLGEKHGIWGGAGAPTRRRLARLTQGLLADEHPAGCTCTFCIQVTAHVDALRRAYHPITGEPMHGRWEAYQHAGCRCTPCQKAWAEAGRDPVRGRPPKVG